MIDRQTDGVDGRRDGWGGWMDGQTDGLNEWMDGQTDRWDR